MNLKSWVSERLWDLRVILLLCFSRQGLQGAGSRLGPSPAFHRVSVL